MKLVTLISTFLLCLLLAVTNLNVMGEGSKEITNPAPGFSGHTMLSICNDLTNHCSPPLPNQRSGFAAYNCPEIDRLYFVVKNNSENVYLGFNNSNATPGKTIVYRIKNSAGVIVKTETMFPTIPGPGYIANIDQAEIGPSQLYGIGGYTALNWVPPAADTFYIEFSQVDNTTGLPYTGYFNLYLFDLTVWDVSTTTARLGRLYSYAWQFSANNVSFANSYIYSNDSIVTLVKFNGLKGGTWVQYCNEWGCANTGVFENDRKSLNQPAVFTYLPQYKIFLNIPDPTIFPPAISAGQVTSVSPEYNCDNGHIVFHISVDKPGKVVLRLEFDPPLIDRTFTSLMSTGDNAIEWDGLDGTPPIGIPLHNNDNITYTVNYINGLTNLPLFDVEGNDSGFIVEKILPIGPNPYVYWDDTNIPAGTFNFTGCLSSQAPPVQRCHPWESYPAPSTSGFGDGNLINSWWYSVASTTAPVTILEHRGPHTININQLPSTFCAGTGGHDFNCSTDTNATQYFWSYRGTGATITQASLANPNITISFDDYATSGYLRVYPANENCPDSAYMDSIYITVKPKPVLSNNPLSKQVCNNAYTDITLTGSPIGTTFSWTATCPVPEVTGYTNSSGTYINDLLANTSLNPGDVTYVITPFLDGCFGNTYDFTVTSNPTPNGSPNPTSSTICSNQTTAIQLIGSATSTLFSWTATASSPNLSGYFPDVGDSIKQTIVNSGLTVETVTYNIIPTINGCPGNSFSHVVTVKPLPTVSFSSTTPTICSGGTTNISLLSTLLLTTFDWTAVASSVTLAGFSNGDGSSITQTLINSGYTVETVTYSVVPTTDGCHGDSETYTVTVYPVPDLSNTPLSKSICNNTATNVTLASHVAGTLFTWTATGSTAQVTGFSDNLVPTNSLNQTLINSGFLNETVTYHITPHANGCDGVTTDYVVTVYPQADAYYVPVVQIICTGQTADIDIASHVPGATFTWTASPSSLLLSGYSDGGGANITQTIFSTSTAVELVTYTVTPTANGCIGTPSSVVVTVNPGPDISTTPLAQTICSGTLATINITSNVAGTTFAWTAASSSTNITGFSDGAGNIISQTLTNSGFTIETVTYSMTPSANGCTGGATPYVVTVNPVPDLSIPSLLQRQCSNQATLINLTSNVSGTLFTWTAAGSTAQVTGYSDNLVPTVSLNQTLINTGFTPETVTYTITPHANGCDGFPVDYLVTVDPVADVFFQPTAQTLCTGQTTNIDILSNVAGTTFTWTATPSSGLVTGFVGGGGNNISQTLTSASFVVETVTYTITPVFNGCTGIPSNVVVTVNPGPDVTTLPLTYAICSTDATNILLTSHVGSTSFNWTASSSSGNLTGFSNGTGSLISQFLTNVGFTVETVTYSVTPMANGCTGTPVNFTVTVNPVPDISNSPLSSQQCSNTATGINLTSNVSGTLFTWTATGSTAQVSGFSDNLVPTTFLNQTLVNSGFDIETVTYSITPHANGCPGLPTDFTVTVYPVADVYYQPPALAICTGQTTNIDILSHIAGSTFTWTAVPGSGLVSGYADGAGSNISQILISTSSTAETVTYNATPIANGCPGVASSMVVTINPSALVTNNPLTQTICSGENVTINLTSNVTGAGFDWVASASSGNVSGFLSGSGNVINQNLVNSGFAIETVTYSITPSANGCDGVVANYIVTVNPVPDLSNTPLSQQQCNNQSTGINLTSNVTGALFTWTAAGSTAQVSGFSDNIVPTSFLNQTLLNSGFAIETVTYTITPHANGCSGTPVIYTVTVYPSADAYFFPSAATICTGQTFSIDILSNVAGTTFTWVPTPGSPTLSGFSAGSGSPISQTLFSTSTVIETVTYTVTPTANGCPGIPADVVVTVNPGPNLTTTPLSQTICSGGNVTINLTSDVVGCDFSWNTTPSSGSLSGFAAGTGTVINQNIVNSGSTTETVTYGITPSANGCTGGAVNYIVTIHPVPDLSNTPANHSQCNNQSTAINLTSNVSGTLFTWTATGSTAQVAGYSNNNVPTIFLNQTLVNTGIDVEFVTYHLTPQANGCDGLVTDYVVTVYPSVDISLTPATQSICTGQTTNIGLSSLIGGATFSWTVTPSSPLLSGYSSGTGSTIAQTIFSTSGAIETATYTVTPHANGCDGTPADVVITINPGPALTTSPLTDTICSSGITNILLTSNVAGATFSWIATGSSGNVTGFSDGIGNSIIQTLLNTGLVQEVVTYHITPAANGCIGGDIHFEVAVHPVPDLSNTPASSQQCNNQASSITLTSHVPGTLFTWTATGSSAQVGGYSNNATPSLILNQTLINTGFNLETVTYHLTPHANGCDGNVTDFVVTVFPSADAYFLPPTQTICTGQTTNIDIFSHTTGATYSWIPMPGSPLLSGFSAGNGSNISQTIFSTSAIAETLIYTVTPSANGCVGIPSDVTVTINPGPVITTTPLAASLCSTDPTNITLTSNVAGATYSWIAAGSSANVTGFTDGTGNTIIQTLINSGVAIETVTYSITPAANSCIGGAVDFVVTVNPIPDLSNTPLNQQQCNNQSTGINLTSNVAGTLFTWTAAGSSAQVTGFSDNLTPSTLLNQILVNSGFTIETVTYTITPHANGCDGLPVVYTVTVNPSADTYFSPSSETLCTGQTTNVSILSHVASATFTWIATPSTPLLSGFADGNGSTISQTLLSSSNLIETVTYTVTPEINGCSGIPSDVVVVVNPGPAVTTSPLAKTICSTNVTGINLTANVAGTVFNWTASASSGTISGYADGTGDFINQTLNNSGFTVETVTYFITPIANSCIGGTVAYVVTVNPVPDLSNLPLLQQQCNNQSTGVNLTSNVAGTTFTWTATGSSAQISGYTNGVGPSVVINDILVNTGYNTETVTYTITPQANGCDGVSTNYVITVYPTPDSYFLPATQAICTGQSTNIDILSHVTGTTFTWVALPSIPLLSGYSGGAGNNISQVIFSTSPAIENITYTATPFANGCTGTSTDVLVTINPGPDLTTTPLFQTICSETDVNINLTSSVAGATFTWVATGSSPNLSGFSNGTGALISQVVKNSGFTIETITYAITPAANGCTGGATNYVVTVNPMPDLSNMPLRQEQCNNQPTGIALTSNVTGTLFTWTTAGSSPQISGFSDNGIPGTTINQTLINSGFNTETVTYRIKPRANGCDGLETDYVVTVYPTPDLALSPASQSQCNNLATGINLTSNVIGTQFTWTASGSSPQVSGFSNNSAPTSLLDQVLVNSGYNVETVTYLLTPVANGCNGVPVPYVVTVFPTPDLSNSPLSQEQCNNQPTGINLTSNVAGTLFTWTATGSTVQVSGYSDNTTPTVLLNQTLVNSGNNIEVVTYRITPRANGCDGLPYQYTVTVYPEPTVTNTPLTQTICSNTGVVITLTSGVAGTTFAWNCTASSPNLSGYANGNSNLINQTLINSGNTIETVTYHIIPSASGCTGIPVDYIVTVNPMPMVTNVPLTSQVCSGETTSINLTSNVAGTSFTWTASGSSANVTGYFAGTGNLINQTLINSGILTETVTYSITPSANGCTGVPANFVVTVFTAPTVQFTPPIQTICSGGTSLVQISSNNINSTFTWTASASSPNVSGYSNGAGNLISQTILNLGNTLETVTYVVTPTLLGCPVAVPQSFVLSVQPMPTVTNATRTTTICSSTTTNISLIPNVPGSTFSWTASGSSAAVSGFGPGSGSLIQQTLLNTGVDIETVTYVVTANANGCDGDTAHFQVLVYPVADVYFTPAAQAICPLQSCNIAIQSHSTGVLFNWTASGSSGNVSGYLNGSGALIQQTLNNTGLFVESVTYHVTPSIAGCVGTGNNVVVTVNPGPRVTMPVCWDNLITTEAQPIRLKWGIPLGGTYSGTGVAGNFFNPAVAGAGTFTLSYTYTNTFGCTDHASQTITVVNTTPFTCGNNFLDVRDNQNYRSVSINGQCWMAENLDFGNIIFASQMQRDNCYTEKYCYEDNLVNCSSLGGLYQWDELMKFEDQSGAQGICPSGWHIPSEGEWNSLMNFFIAGGYIGSPINNGAYYGFDAIAAGARFHTSKWDFRGFATMFWTSTSRGSTKAWAHGMNTYNGFVSSYPGSRSNAFSIRCVKD